MKRAQLLLALAATAALLWHSVTPAQAICLPESQGGPSFEDSVRRYPIIVLVQVVGNTGSNTNALVERYMKGTGSGLFSMTLYSDTSEPLPPLDIGRRAVVFLSADPKGANVRIDECNPTFLVPTAPLTDNRLGLVEQLLVAFPSSGGPPSDATVQYHAILFGFVLGAIGAIALAASFVFPARGSRR